MSHQSRSKQRLRSVLTVLLPLAVSSFSTCLFPFQHRSASRRRFPACCLYGSKVKTGYQLPTNEFSRMIQPEKFLKTRRDYVVDIAATPEECHALASRFGLSDIAKLEASLNLRPERIGGRSGADGVEVEGTVHARVTQTCVRTNEDFQVNLEFPLYAIVRPVLPLNTALLQEHHQAQSSSKQEYQSDNNKSSRKSAYRPADRNINEMDLMELQRMLQLDISDEEDVLMEDESIYPLEGRLDVGELTSQLFWLALDPYPKRPGSEPIQRSITG